MTTAPARDGPQRITIDLDAAWCYRRIHGHGADDGDDEEEEDGDDDPLLVEALPRLLQMLAELRARATLFVVGRDVAGRRAQGRVARLLRDAVAAGHDLQSHSFAHAYALSRWPHARIVDDVGRSLDAIAAVAGTRPRGFRAPGYNLSPTLRQALVDVGVRWSSSRLPSPAYWALRLGVIARTRLRGRRSASLVGDLRAFEPAHPFARAVDGADALREIPITTAGTLPWTGTTLALLPDAAAHALTTLALAGVRGDDVVFELHAADFVDGRRHLPPDQPDARVPLTDKLRRIRATLARVVDA
jgi:peptidoglycan/xylan/chitin deacetylase (PgdA/CDA1 family)